jgi:hypothetical protein
MTFRHAQENKVPHGMNLSREPGAAAPSGG